MDNGFKVFAIVFAALLLAELAADAVRALWLEDALAAMATSQAGASDASGVGGVTFKNASANFVRCSMQRGSAYAPFLGLDGGQSKRFRGFALGKRLRCHTELDSYSTTVLTYFTPRTAGTYEMRLERVTCPTCKGADWRWATVVVAPNGTPYYSDLR